ncbi:MAG: NADH-quinone oxidoreductase subunit I [Bacteroidota bacterium]
MNEVKQYFRNIWMGIYTVLIGMKVTWGHLFVPAVTIQYPDVKLKLPDRARNRLYVNIDDCIGCDLCSKACPVDCIYIDTIKSIPGDDLGITSNGMKKRLWVPKFDIDIAKCCYCGLCVYPCPTECIKMTDVFEFSEFERHNFIYNYSAMAPDQVEEAKTKHEKWEKDQAARRAAAAAKPATPKPTAATTGQQLGHPSQTKTEAPKQEQPKPDTSKNEKPDPV